MTRSELTFALLVESLLHHIHLPEYRQIIVEVFALNIRLFNELFSLLISLIARISSMKIRFRNIFSFLQLLTIVSTILLRNPELSFQKQLNLNILVEDAVLMYCKVCTMCVL